MLARQIKRISSLAAAFLITGSACYALPFQKSKYAKQPVDSPDVQDLIVKLANQPELMCLQYLHLVIGNPENLDANTRWRTPHKHYIWYQKKGAQGVKFELTQEEPQPGSITQANFIARLTDLKLNLHDVEGKFGEDAKKYYDQNCAPTEEYSLVPNTLLKFSQPHKARMVKTMQVYYNGPPLPEASPDEIAAATQNRKTVAMTHVTNANYKESLPLLLEHIKENPADMEAQVALAQVYAGHCNINDAINQYKFVLANANGDQNAVAQATKGLQDLRVLPSTDADTQELHHQYQLQQGGEGFRARDVQQNNGALATNQSTPPTAPQPLLPTYPGGIYAQKPGSGSNFVSGNNPFNGTNSFGSGNAGTTASANAAVNNTLGVPSSPPANNAGGWPASPSSTNAFNTTPISAPNRFSKNPSAPLDLSSLDPDF